MAIKIGDIKKSITLDEKNEEIARIFGKKSGVTFTIKQLSQKEIREIVIKINSLEGSEFEKNILQNLLFAQKSIKDFTGIIGFDDKDLLCTEETISMLNEEIDLMSIVNAGLSLIEEKNIEKKSN